jgi:predicted phage tail protein
MRSIKVYGSLAKFLGKRSFKAAVNTPAEAVRFLLANFPGLRAHMQDQHYKVGVGSSELEIGNHPEHLHFPTAQEEQIRIIPVIAGAGATGKILIGVALIAAAILFPVGGALASAAFTLGSAAVPIVMGIGVSLVLGGVSQLLTPTQKMSSGDDSINDPKKSYSFSGVQNVNRQGVPVNIVFGECLVGSIVISAGINTEEA